MSVGIGHTSWLLAQRPGMGVMLSPDEEPRGGQNFEYERYVKSLREAPWRARKFVFARFYGSIGSSSPVFAGMSDIGSYVK